MVYLDNAATTPLNTAAISAMTHVMTETFGNPSSLHAYGRQASKELREAREEMAKQFEVPARKLIFTSGGTEGNNTAIKGYALANQAKGKHLITTAIEHHSVLHTMAYLEERFGFEVTYIQPENQVITAQQIADALRDDTILVSVMYANNETGMIQPIDAIGALARQKGIAFHVDAVQAFGYVPIRPLAQGIDMLTVCSHKIYGPKGVGALYIRHGLNVAAEAYGGPQEHRLRAGTENVAAIAGFGKAAELLEAERDDRVLAARRLTDTVYDRLIKGDARFHLNGRRNHVLPNIIDFSVDGVDSAILLIALDLQGLAVSAGSACEAGAVEASHVLQAMGIEEKWLRSSIRLSVGKENTLDEIKRAVAIIGDAVRKSRGESL